MKIACLSYGERGESQWAWKTAGVKLEDVKAQRKAEAEEAAAILGASIEFFDAGDYPLRGTEAILDRLIDIYPQLTKENCKLAYGQPRQEIHSFAKEHHCDLIVVGSHGRHGLALLLGSTANDVLHGAPCDVLAVSLKKPD